MHRKLLFGALLVVASVATLTDAVAAIVVTTGSPTGDFTSVPAVRYKDFKNADTGRQHYLGIDDLGVGSNRVENQYRAWGDTSNFSFAFDGGTGLSSFTTPTPTPLNYTLGSSPGTINLIKLLVRNTGAGATPGTLTLSNLVINGESVGTTFSATNQYLEFGLSNFGTDLSTGFTITGTISRNGSAASNFGKGEQSQVQFKMGRTVVPEPSSALAIGLGLLLAAGVRRRRRVS